MKHLYSGVIYSFVGLCKNWFQFQVSSDCQGIDCVVSNRDAPTVSGCRQREMER
jgi:hypothetical protein